MSRGLRKSGKPELLFFKAKDGTIQLEVRVEGETVWLSLNQMAELFERDKSVISRHIKNIFEEGELEEKAVVAKNATTAADGKAYQVEHYNLDVIISVGYRVKSLRGTQFRIWATERLREYIIKGFTLDDERLKNGPVSRVYFDELLERIREIRSSERNLYRKVLDIYATSIDYDPESPISKEFFATVQNKMHFAAHGHTAAEVIVERADASKANMGLTNWPGNRIRKADVAVAKNYLNKDELDILNRIVSQYLEYAELQAISRKTMAMKDWAAKLDDFLRFNGREVLKHAGKISAELAEELASGMYEQYRLRRSKEDAEKVDADFERAAKRLPGKAKP